MDLSPYLDGLRRDLGASVAAGGPDAERTGEQLVNALEPAVRLTLLEVLSEAAAEITAALDAATVDVRLRGRDADIVVTQVADESPVATYEPPADTEGDTARVTLRLPEHLKALAERAAAAEGISVNAWLVRAVGAALHPGHGPFTSPNSPRRGRRITGFAQS
jgi:predicted HicB family RNase H-like nuclease